MKTNTIKRAFAAIAVSAVALSAAAINASAATAVGYTPTGEANGFTGASLALTQKTIKLDEAGETFLIEFSAKSSNGTQFDATGIHIQFDDALQLVPLVVKNREVVAEDMQGYDAIKAVEDGDQAIFLTTANDVPITVDADGTVLWQFQLKLRDASAAKAGDVYPIEVSFLDGDLFDLKTSEDTLKIRDYAFSNVEQGYIAIEEDEVITTTTAAPVTTTSSTSAAPATSTTSSTTVSGSNKSTTATTTKKVSSTTKKKEDAADTGVPGVGIAVAGLAIAVGTAFVLRKKED